MTDPMRHDLVRSKKKAGIYESKERFVKLTFDMLNSAAWQFLRPNSVQVYIQLAKRFNGHNNGKISMSLNEAAVVIKAGKQTVKAAIDQLVEHGFIKIIKKGYFTGRKATEYALTEFRFEGYPPTRDWKSWQSKKKHRRTQIPDLGIQTTLDELQGSKTKTCTPELNR